MATSHRQWSEEKERELIAFYSENDYLWNPKAKLYKNRALKAKAFQILCLQLSDAQQHITEEDIKRKFKNLRTVFSREHSMVLKSSRLGAGAEDIYHPKWKYYHILSFLRNPCTPEDSSDDLTAVWPAPSTSQFPENNTSSPFTYTHTLASAPTTPAQPHCRKVVSQPKKQRLDEAAEDMQYSVGFLKRKHPSPSPHAGFLHYLESCLESLPDTKAKKLKRQIIDLAHAAQDDE